MNTGLHKVRIKIGDAEFEAEGSEESVKQQYADFLAALSARSPSSQPPAPPPIMPPSGGAAGGDIDADRMGRVFKTEGELVSLQFLPTGENTRPDALLMLLYGYSALKNQQMVLGTQLVKAGNQSGLGLERVDRSLDAYQAQNFVLKGGVRKGTKYGLTVPGKKKAEELIKALQL